jgi:uncharacterized RDD family membrane protein YckC
MNQYEISTAQNVTLKLTIANMGDRILAAMIDLGILSGYLSLIWYVESTVRITTYSLEFWIEMFFLLPACLYSLAFEFFMDGQTPGKRIRKVKVVRMDGESLTFGNCIIRWLFRLVDIWFDSGSVAIVAATFSKSHQRLGDMVAGTILINTRPQTELHLSKYADLSSTDAVCFPQVERLQFKDMEVVSEALGLYYELDNFDYVQQVAKKLKALLEIVPEMDDLSFVKRVLTDYNILHQAPLN